MVAGCRSPGGLHPVGCPELLEEPHSRHLDDPGKTPGFLEQAR